MIKIHKDPEEGFLMLTVCDEVSWVLPETLRETLKEELVEHLSGGISDDVNEVSEFDQYIIEALGMFNKE